MDAEDLRSGDATSAQRIEQERGDRRIADRLDALEAERVLARAIELDQADHTTEDPRITLTAEQLELVATEIGVDPMFVRQALAEVRLAPDDRNRLDRLLLPERLAESETLTGWTREEAEKFAISYFREFEGLVEQSRLRDGIDWNVDGRVTSRMRTSLATGSNRVSKATGNDIGHRIRSVGDDAQVVTLQSSGERPLLLAKAGLALALFVLLGGVVGALGLGIGSFVQALAGSALTAGAIGAGAVVVARRWAGNVRRALRRSMTRFADVAAQTAESRQPRSDGRRRWRARDRRSTGGPEQRA